MSKRSNRRARGRAQARIPLPPQTLGATFSAFDLASTIAKTRASQAKEQSDPFKVNPELHPKSTSAGLAMDSSLGELAAWGHNSCGAGGNTEGFIGYAALALLATIAEYRRAAETVARHMTRKWITLQAKGDDKAQKLTDIEAEMIRLGVRGVFQKMAEQDCYFGRAHLFLDFGDWDDRAEIVKPIGDGQDTTSKAKCNQKRPLKRLAPVEAIWCYPLQYNASDPLAPDWYKPQIWAVNGKQIHASRLLPFVGREVPDLLKPSYSFGGISLSQMGKPSVDNWLETRQSVSDIISAFSVMVLKMKNLGEALNAQGEALFQRTDLFNAQRDNRGLLTIDSEEDFVNVAAPLGTLDNLQAQSQEHMASIWGIPIEILNGIQPMGLNASSEGQIRVFHDWINSCQEHLFRPNLTVVINFIQLSLFGEVDPNITFIFNDLESMDDAEKAEIENKKAMTHQIYNDMQVASTDEVRKAVSADVNSPYHGLDLKGGDDGDGEADPPDAWGALAESMKKVA